MTIPEHESTARLNVQTQTNFYLEKEEQLFYKEKLELTTGKKIPSTNTGASDGAQSKTFWTKTQKQESLSKPL